ncbi:MAG TPA: helix-turn-helix transcriptional regulator [Longimicrobiales bacterium]|nr:helix-turn-helix transcriptional regulator [Longimicrobiales bacterium]
MYREHAPPRRLTPFVECIWTTQGVLPPGAQRPIRVLPDGCMDVLFNVGDPPLPEGCPHHRLRSYLVGAMPTATVVRVVGRVALVGVRFRPGGAQPFLRMPAHEARAGVVPLEDVWGPAGAEATERLAEAAGPGERAALLGRLLEVRLEDGDRPDGCVARSDAMIRRSWGAARVTELAAAAGTTVRSLERRYAAGVGLTPKEAARVARFSRAVQGLSDTTLPLARVAVTCGYADQAHLSREVRALAGITAMALREERRAVAAVASVQDGDGRAA